MLKASPGRRNLENIDKVPLLERKREIITAQAKERQIRKPGDSVVENLPQQNDKTRDALAGELGVSGKTYDVVRTVSLEGTDAFKLALGRRYNRTKKSQGGDRRSEESKDQNEPLISTAAKLAAEHKVSAATVKRAAQSG